MNYSVAARALAPEPGNAATRFVGWLTSGTSIGAICESSPRLARRMAEAAMESGLPIVELGAGYGSVTRFLPENTVSVERDPARLHALRTTFPARIIHGECALNALGHLHESTVVVSSIPSINNPEFGALRLCVARAVSAGTVRKLIVYTYFPINPFAGIFPHEQRIGFEMLNLPPAFLWSYTC